MVTQAAWESLRPVAIVASQPPSAVHYDYYTGSPLDEDLHQQGKEGELQAMKDDEVYT